MGGTTAKTCLIQGGRPTTANVVEAGRVHRFKHGSGLPIKVPVVDMIEIGAGGGSIAWHDALGLLKVGPVSAGADPGPASYGLGGAEPTVTDACLRLGYFDPDFFLGGRMALGPEAASNALTHLGDALDLETEAVAWGVYRVVCENMAQATRVHIIEQGHDPRNYQLMAFGARGAGARGAGRPHPGRTRGDRAAAFGGGGGPGLPGGAGQLRVHPLLPRRGAPSRLGGGGPTLPGPGVFRPTPSWQTPACGRQI